MTIETIPYAVELRDGPFEIRAYGRRIVAEASVDGERDRAANAGFRRLAAYLFGGNSQRRDIAMTSPVLQSRVSKATLESGDLALPEAWTIRFALPRDATLGDLPQPTDPTVRLIQLEPTRAAVIRFSGLTGEKRADEKLAELDAFVTNRKLGPTGPAILARYDPPWTLWFSRRNEIMRELEETALASPTLS